MTKKKTKGKKWILDTNFVIALVADESDFHDRAAEIFNAIPEGDVILLPKLVLLELICGSRYPAQVTNFCRQIADEFPDIEGDTLDTVGAIPIATRKKLKAVDAYLIALTKYASKEISAELLTFDQQLKKAAMSYCS